MAISKYVLLNLKVIYLTCCFLVIDASAKSFDGLLDGTYLFLGQYDQCLAIRYSIGSKDQQAQYALLQMLPKQDNLIDKKKVNQQLENLFSNSLFQLRFGVCLPSECTNTDIGLLFNPSKLLYKSI